MNRQQRCALRAKAKPTPALLANRFYEYMPNGRLARVEHPKAVALLTEACEALLLSGGRPCVARITETEAAAFPAWNAKRSAGMVHAVAVGIDVAGYATCCTQSALVIDKGQVDVAASTEAVPARALAELAQHCSFPGFPASRLEHTRGRA